MPPGEELTLSINMPPKSQRRKVDAELEERKGEEERRRNAEKEEEKKREKWVI